MPAVTFDQNDLSMVLPPRFREKRCRAFVLRQHFLNEGPSVGPPVDDVPKPPIVKHLYKRKKQKEGEPLDFGLAEALFVLPSKSLASPAGRSAATGDS